MRDAASRYPAALAPAFLTSSPPPSFLLYLRILAEAEQLRGAANGALPAPGAARCPAGTRARRIPRLEHVSRLQPAAGGSPACPARFGACFLPGPSCPPGLGGDETGLGRWGAARFRGSLAWRLRTHSYVHRFSGRNMFNVLGNNSRFIRLLQAAHNPNKVSHCC